MYAVQHIFEVPRESVHQTSVSDRVQQNADAEVTNFEKQLDFINEINNSIVRFGVYRIVGPILTPLPTHCQRRLLASPIQHTAGLTWRSLTEFSRSIHLIQKFQMR